jgi:ring-1,2-phenylacetyl-CoA epoxidase subunit PaaD
MVTAVSTLAEITGAVGNVPDPEIPVLTIADLGILRDVSVAGGRVTVTITPTYSGCPAMETIVADVRRVLADQGHPDAEVRTVLAPAWTTDWMSEDGKRKLTEYGIAPPGRAAATTTWLPSPGVRVRCPRCGSADTRESSRFGSTACKSLWVCGACREPFDHFKAI